MNITKRFSLILGLALALAQTPAYATVPATMNATAATNITTSGAVLHGSWDANGFAPTQVRFEYGTTSSLGSFTPYVTQSAPTGTYDVTLSGLTASTTYYFQAMGINASGAPAYSSPILSFTTASPTLPAIMTTAATSVGLTSATLNGSFDAKGTSTDTWFEYGTTTALSQSTTPVTQASTRGAFSETISGLTPNTKYYFRAGGQNINGTVYGSPILSFTTGTNTACTINSFTANPLSVSSGGTATLSWNTSGCASGSIDNGVGTVSPIASGSTLTSPITTSTTYTLTATSSSGSTTTATATVLVSGSGGGTCTIYSFTSNSPVNVGATPILYWNTSGCAILSISGVGSASNGSGQLTASPITASTTYTLTATDSSGATKTAQTMVLVTTGGGGSGGGSTGTCTINSFSPIQSQLPSGGNTVLIWSTTGCNYVTISGGQAGTAQNSPNGSASTGVLVGTTTYTLYAFGSSNSTNQTATVYVTGGPYTYTYACSDGVDNDGDGRIDMNDPGCSTSYDNDEADVITTNGTTQTNNTSIITTPANNVSGQTARLNGILTNTAYQANTYFEYGTSSDALIHATPMQTVSAGTTVNFSDTISVLPNTTYFYRASAQTNRTTIRGSILSFSTGGSTNTTYVGGSSWSTYYGGSSSSSSSVKSGGTNTSAVSMVSIVNKGDKVSIGDTIDYTITYTNTTGKTIRDAILTIVLPQGFTAKQASQGKLISFNTVQVDLGTLTSGQTGSVFLQATVDQGTPLNETLVTTATLSYTLPNNQHDSGVGYVLNHATGSAVFGGFALGSGFFPTTIFGWIMTVIIILVLILLARRITRGKNAGHGSGHH